jgi:hypothetical protein
MIDGEWRSANFDELLSFGKERQKTKIRRFSSDLNEKFWVHETMAMAKLKLARGTVLEFRADWIKHRLNPARDEKKRNSFSKKYF